MTEHNRPEFTSGTLPTYIGYHLQIFGAGRAKISLQTVTNKKHEFYAARPQRDRAALLRQKARSLAALPAHYAALDQILSAAPDAKVFRIHEKGNNNATADNAHLLASLEQEALWLVMSGVVHRWELTPLLVHVLLNGKGKRTGEASIFNEYMPSYEHDWQDAEFELEDYRVGTRSGGAAPALPCQPERPLRPTPQPEPTPKVSIKPKPVVALDYHPDNPNDDAVLFTDPPTTLPEDPFPEPEANAPWQTTTIGRTTLYSTDALRAQVLAGR